jgi:hypothetical protein
VSVPLGVGANHDDRRQAIHAIRASDTAMAEAGAERGVEGKQHVQSGARDSSETGDRARLPIEQFTSRAKSLRNTPFARCEHFILRGGFHSERVLARATTNASPSFDCAGAEQTLRTNGLEGAAS